MKPIFKNAFLLSIAMGAGNAWSADLMQVLRDAQANDAVYASARAARDAGRESLPQGEALLRPTVNASAFSQWNDLDIRFRDSAAPLSSRDFISLGLTFNLSHPLFNFNNLMLYREAGFKVAQAEAQFAQSAQDLIIRTAQAYFDVLAAQDSLAFLQAQKAAISEQLAQARRNFEVGTATITDTHEAQSRFDLAVSQEIAAQNDIEIKRRALQLVVGKFPDRLVPLRAKFTLHPPQPTVMDRWVESAEKENFVVRAQEAALEVATREIERLRAGHFPTVNLVGSYGLSGQGGSSIGTTSAGTDVSSRIIGVQVAIPLYTGGTVDSQVRQAIANREKARADLDSNRRQAALQARQAFLGVTNGMAQVSALEQALLSSETALASNRLGYEVGVRINIDVLNAQQQVFSTKRDLSKARYDTIMNGLKLKSASGGLSDADIEQVNRLLGGD